MSDKLNEAISLHQNNQFNEAEQAYIFCLEENASHPKANHLYGLLQYQTGRKLSGIEMIEKSISILSSDPRPYMDLVKMYKLENRLDDAIELLRDFYKQFNEPKAMVEIASIATVLGNTNSAIEAYRKAIESMPSTIELHYNLGNALRTAGRVDEAIEAYRNTLQLDAAFMPAILNLASQLNLTKDFQEALAILNRAPKENTNTYEYHFLTAHAYMGFLEEAKAEYHLRAASKLTSEPLTCLETLAHCLFRQLKHSEAKELALQALDIDSHSAIANYVLGDILALSGDIEQARVKMWESFQKNPNFMETIRCLLNYRGLPNTQMDQVVHAAKNCCNAKSTFNVEERSNLLVTLGTYYEKNDQIYKAFKFLEEGNKLLRSSYEYDEAKHLHAFLSMQELDSNLLLNAQGHLQANAIFIVGMPRSGTSLIEQIMSCHSKVNALGESTCFPNEVRKLGASMSSRLSSSLINLLGENYVKALNVPQNDKPFFTDKLPFNFRNIGLIAAALPNAKIIHCVRDPVETCLSIYKHIWEDAPNIHPYAQDFKELATFYKTYVELMNHWYETCGERIYRIDYEQVVTQPEAEIANILDFCGLPFENACLEFYKSKRIVNTTSAYQVKRSIYKDSLAISDRYGDELDELRTNLSTVAPWKRKARIKTQSKP